MGSIPVQIMSVSLGEVPCKKKTKLQRKCCPIFFLNQEPQSGFQSGFFGRILKTAFSVAEILIFGSGAPHLINFPKNVPRNL